MAAQLTWNWRHLVEYTQSTRQGHVKIAACAEIVTLSDELWNTAAPERPAQGTLSLKFGLQAMVTFRYRRRT